MLSGYPEVLVRLDGAGDDFRVIGQVTKAMRRAGIAEQEIETFCDEAISGHDHRADMMEPRELPGGWRGWWADGQRHCRPNGVA